MEKKPTSRNGWITIRWEDLYLLLNQKQIGHIGIQRTKKLKKQLFEIFVYHLAR
jgi:hypothetical protein